MLQFSCFGPGEYQQINIHIFLRHFHQTQCEFDSAKFILHLQADFGIDRQVLVLLFFLKSQYNGLNHLRVFPAEVQRQHCVFLKV